MVQGNQEQESLIQQVQEADSSTMKFAANLIQGSHNHAGNEDEIQWDMPWKA